MPINEHEVKGQMFERSTAGFELGIISYFSITHFSYFCCKYQPYPSGWLSSQEITAHENN